MSQINLVISAGQLGADLGALEAARAHGIHTGGHAKVGTKTAEFLSKYGLKEEAKYDACDRANADKLLEPNGLVIAFLMTKPLTGAGSQKTVNYALFGRYEVFSTLESQLTQDIARRGWVVKVGADLGTGEAPENGRRALIFYDMVGEHLDTEAVGNDIRDFLLGHPEITTLLVTGSCEDTYPGIQVAVKKILTVALAPPQARVATCR